MLWRTGAIWTVLGSLTATTSAHACAVCMGNADSRMVQGAGAGVLFMLVLTYAMLIFGFGGIATVWFVRARRLALAKGRAARTAADAQPQEPPTAPDEAPLHA